MKFVAVIAIIALVLGWCGAVLNRIDKLRAEDLAVQAEIRLTKAQIAQARAELELLGRRVRDRDLKPDNRIGILSRRTEALRGAIWSLIRIGKASFLDHPGMEWERWPFELAEVP